MNYILTFKQFNASLNESMQSYSINSKEDLNIIDDIIAAAEAMNQSDPVMWRGMSTKDPNFRFSRNEAFVHLTTDRTSFRGGNEGATKMMSFLKIDQPVFVSYSAEHSKFFGPVYAIIPKRPWKVIQSELVTDVKAFNKEYIYSAENGSRKSITIGKYRIDDNEKLKLVIAEIEKLGYAKSKMKLTELEGSIHKMDNSEEEFVNTYTVSSTNELSITQPPDWQEIEKIKRTTAKGSKYGGIDLDDHKIGTVHVRNTGKHMIERAKKGAKSYTTLSGTKPKDINIEAILNCKDYWAVLIDDVIKRGGKFMKIKSASDAKTYKNITDALYTFKSYRKWQESR
jgi:hypothetical protein